MSDRAALSTLTQTVLADEGIRFRVSAADRAGAEAAAELMNDVIAAALAATGVNADGRLTPGDLAALSRHIRADPDLYADFLEGHGDDEGREETGFHLVQGDGGTSLFQNRRLVDTVADAIYHVGFRIVDGRFQNEDGDQNETVADVAGWLNWFVNGENAVYGSDAGETLHSGTYSVSLAAAEAEVFHAGGGDDAVWAGRGDDTVRAGTGDDRVGGEEGRDLLLGQGGDDALFGGGDNDRLWGGSGADLLAGQEGNDGLFGEDGADTLWGEDGADRLSGGAGTDVLGGGTGTDTLLGGDGADTLWGEEGADRIEGGGGADRIGGGWGRDTAEGGAGADRIAGDAGDDHLAGGGGADTLWGGDGRDRVWGGDDSDRAYGGDGDDRLYGDRGDDLLDGQAGDDRLLGQAGRDTLTGGDGSDTLIGGAGADVLQDWEAAGAPDVFVFAAGHSGLGDAADVVRGFDSGQDRLDLRGYGALTFEGAVLSGAGPSVAFDDRLLRIDLDGDGAADEVIVMEYLSALVEADLILG